MKKLPPEVAQPFTSRLTSGASGPSLSKQYKLTEKHKNLYRHWVQWFMLQLGQGSWRIVFEIRADRQNYAWAQADPEAKMVKFGLSTVWPQKPTEERLKSSALHEVLHVSVIDLLHHAEHSGAWQDNVTGEQHRLINGIEHIIYGRQDEDIKDGE